MKLKDLLTEKNFVNPNYSDLKYMDKLGHVLMDLDDILDDSTDYYDRTEMKKFDDAASQYTLSDSNIKADNLKNQIDAVVKFYETAVNNKIKKQLDLMKKEANSFKAKIK